MKKSKLLVVGGGSSNGKSDLLEELGKRGYNTYKEPAKEFLRERKSQQSKEEYENPDYNENVYRQTEIYKRVTVQENSLSRVHGVHFIERCAIEALAFNKHLLGHILPITQEFPPKSYEEIFIPDSLEFVADGTRIEKDGAEAREIHDMVIAEYFHQGYRPHLIPKMQGTKQEQIEKRADLVMKLAAEAGHLEDVYRFSSDQEWDERRTWSKRLGYELTKIHDLLYAELRKKSSEKVYNPKQLGEIINELSPEANFDSSSVNSILSCLERDRILINIGGSTWKNNFWTFFDL